MGKITDVMGVYLTRADGLAGGANHFKSHTQITKGEHVGELELPNIVTYCDLGEMENNDHTRKLINFEIKTIIRSPKETGYYNSVSDIGALKDLEVLMNGILADWDFGSTAYEAPEASFDFIENESENIIINEVTFSFKTHPFGEGSI